MMSIDFNDETTLVVEDGTLSTTIDGEEVIMDAANGTYYGLNEVGSRIWNLLSEPKTVAHLQDELLAEYEVDPAYCRNEVDTFLHELVEQELVQIVDEGEPE